MKVTYRERDVCIATGGRDLGDGDLPAIVFVHGAGMDRTTWQLQARWFAHHGYRVAALDLPGHGLSDGPPLESIEEMADWTAGLIRELDLAPAHIVGFSLGTFVALEVAAETPELAASLVLVGTAVAMPVHPELLTAAYDDVPRASRLMTSWSLGSRAHKGGNRSPGMWLAGGSAALIDRSSPEALGNDMAACNAYGGALDAARRVQCPVTFVLGSEDKMTPVRAAAEVIDAIEQSTVVVLDSTGHMMPIEDPIRAREAIAEAIGWDGTR